MLDSTDWRNWWKSSSSCATLDDMRKEEKTQNTEKSEQSEKSQPTEAEKKLRMFRAEIDDIDLKVATLLSRRHEIVVEIGKQKHVLGVQVHDDQRERFVLDRVSAQGHDGEAARFIVDVYQRILSGSRAAQTEKPEA
jgi:chorismate mutase